MFKTISMALKGIAVPKPAKYFSVENFLGAGATYGGIYVLERYLMPQITPRIPLAGEALAVANIAVKTLAGFGAFYASKKTAGLASDALAGVSFGCTISAVADAVNLAASKIKAMLASKATSSVTYAPPVTVTPVAPTPPPVTATPAPTPTSGYAMSK